MKRLALATLALVACHASPKVEPPLDAASPPIDAGPIVTPIDAGPTAELPNRLTVVASAKLPMSLNDVFSWSSDGRFVAARKDGVITILDTTSLTVARTLKMPSVMLGERCFVAVVDRPKGVDLVDLASDPPKTTRKIRWSAKLAAEDMHEPDFSLSDDCRFFARSQDEGIRIYDGEKLAKDIHDDDIGAGGTWSGRLTSSGHFIAWDTWHAGYVSTVFQDLRVEGHGGGTFGGGSTMSPDDRFVVDTGHYSFNNGENGEDEDGLNQPSRLVQSANGRAVRPFQAGVGDGAFCATSKLFAVTKRAKNVELYDLPNPAPIASILLPFDPLMLSFSNDGTLVLAANEAEMALLRVESCTGDGGSCVASTVCARK